MFDGLYEYCQLSAGGSVGKATVSLLRDHLNMSVLPRDHLNMSVLPGDMFACVWHHIQF